MWSQVVGEVGEVSASVVVVVKKLLKNQCMKSLIVFVRGRCTPSYSYSTYSTAHPTTYYILHTGSW